MAEIALVAAQPDPPMWWSGGCPCCAPRDDVARALRALLPRVRRDEVRRVVIETTGLADPGPILATLLSDTVAASAYRLDAIVTVVDAVNGMAALDGGGTNGRCASSRWRTGIVLRKPSDRGPRGPGRR